MAAPGMACGPSSHAASLFLCSVCWDPPLARSWPGLWCGAKKQSKVARRPRRPNTAGILGPSDRHRKGEAFLQLRGAREITWEPGRAATAHPRWAWWFGGQNATLPTGHRCSAPRRCRNRWGKLIKDERVIGDTTTGRLEARPKVGQQQVEQGIVAESLRSSRLARERCLSWESGLVVLSRLPRTQQKGETGAGVMVVVVEVRDERDGRDGRRSDTGWWLAHPTYV